MRALVAVPDTVLVQRVMDETVLLDLASGRYYGLDAVAARMFELACALPDARTVVAVLAEEFEAEPDVLRADLDRLLRELVVHGLVARTAAAEARPPRPASP